MSRVQELFSWFLYQKFVRITNELSINAITITGNKNSEVNDGLQHELCMLQFTLYNIFGAKIVCTC